jgi:hypothetical protein
MNQEETSTEPRKNEAEVDARIAKIRARNEALLKRRAEVEEDRKSAEEKLASVSIKAQVNVYGYFKCVSKGVKLNFLYQLCFLI